MRLICGCLIESSFLCRQHFGSRLEVSLPESFEMSIFSTQKKPSILSCLWMYKKLDYSFCWLPSSCSSLTCRQCIEINLFLLVCLCFNNPINDNFILKLDYMLSLHFQYLYNPKTKCYCIALAGQHPFFFMHQVGLNIYFSLSLSACQRHMPSPSLCIS